MGRKPASSYSLPARRPVFTLPSRCRGRDDTRPCWADGVRVAIITESFLPHTNGVVNSVLHTVNHLASHGHEVWLAAPSSPGMPTHLSGIPVRPLPSIPLPGYPQVRLAVAQRPSLTRALRDAAPDVVHLASPINVGYRANAAALRLGLPTVAVYQTDVPAYARRYGMAGLHGWLDQRVREVHTTATLTLSPSTASTRHLASLGVTRIRSWARGVDGALFHPRRRSSALRSAWAPGGERIIGYVGRLAPEKQVADLLAIADLPGTRLVIIGEGPERPGLMKALPRAHFTGHLRGEALGVAVASLDVFVTPGESETFGQTLQEAMAAGVPVVAPAAGGPLDLVDPSRTGWLYAPGDLAGLRAHVLDLIGDDAKRAAMGATAHHAMSRRTWEHTCAALVGHYQEAISRQDSLSPRTRPRPWPLRRHG